MSYLRHYHFKASCHSFVSGQNVCKSLSHQDLAPSRAATGHSPTFNSKGCARTAFDPCPCSAFGRGMRLRRGYGQDRIGFACAQVRASRGGYDFLAIARAALELRSNPVLVRPSAAVCAFGGDMGRTGFEPVKAEPADLQSAPFDRFGTYPILKSFILRCRRKRCKGFVWIFWISQRFFGLSRFIRAFVFS